MRTLNRSSTFAALEDIMTGPRTPTLHPCLRRPWLLLALLASVVILPTACSDQPTESTPSQPAPSTSEALPHPRALSQSELDAARSSGYLRAELSTAAMSSAAMSTASGIANTGPKV